MILLLASLIMGTATSNVMAESASIAIASTDSAESQLLIAAEKNDVAELRRLLRKKTSPNTSQPDGMTPLHWAAYHDNLPMVRHLIRAGASPDPKNRYGVTPSSLACLNGNNAIIKLLLKSGANPGHTLKSGETLLMTASRTGKPELVKTLIDYGADINATESKKQTAIMWAASAGNTQTVKVLLDAGADYQTPLRSGFTPFFFAVREGHSDIVNLFLKQTDDTDVKAPMIAEKSGGKLPRKGTTPLILAIENGHFELAMDLLEAGADPNEQLTGFSPLHTLTWVRKPNRGDGIDGTPPPPDHGSLSSSEFIRLLLNVGANPNIQLKSGRAGRGRLNLKGATPFIMACMTADLEFLKLLYEFGADPHLTNVDGTTPLMAAAGIGTLAPQEVAGTEPEALAVIDFLMTLEADVNAVDDNGESAIHGAAYKSFPLVIKKLDHYGADIKIWNRKNKYGWTPLLIAEGYRPGNYRPSFDTMKAIHDVMIAHGKTPPPRTLVDPNGPRKGYEQ